MKFLDFIIKNKFAIAVLLLVVITTWNIRGCFTPSQKNEKMIRQDEQIKHLERDRIKDSLLTVEKLNAKDIRIKELQDQDTIYVNKLISNDKKIKASNDRVNSLADSELERAITTSFDY